MINRIEPKQYVDYFIEKYGCCYSDIDVGSIAIISWDMSIVKSLVERLNAKPSKFILLRNYVYNLDFNNMKISLVISPSGAPSTIMRMEILIACGVKHFIGIGLTGSISSSVPIGNIVIPTFCVREEGTSLHYVSDDSLLKPHPGIYDCLYHACGESQYEVHSGGIWTTDAFFMESLVKINQFSKKGVLCVDMETSAMYALGYYRNKGVCNILVVSDELWNNWNPAFGQPILKDALKKACDIIVCSISKFIKEY